MTVSTTDRSPAPKSCAEAAKRKTARRAVLESSSGLPGEFQGTLGYPVSVYSDCGMEGDASRVTDLAADPAPD